MYSWLLYCTIVGESAGRALLIAKEIHGGQEGIQNRAVSATNTLSHTSELSNL